MNELGLLQTFLFNNDLINDLHQNAGVPIATCGLDEVKLFQTYYLDYQINIVLKEHQNSIIFFRSRKRQNDLFIFA
jgi:hypothetical protein